MVSLKDIKLIVIGLGYVGLPLAIQFSKKRKVTGFDIDRKRINNLINNYDSNGEFTDNDLKTLKNLDFISELNTSNYNCYIITAPTPIDKSKKPDLSYLKNATKIVGNVLKKGDIVIYESTVFPGCTEEVCVPILEQKSNLIYNKDFFCGYSPERINPGDKSKKIQDIKKVTSGSSPKASKIIDMLYAEIIDAGTHLVSSIKVAEAAKVIENSQRDLNIALMNELSIIFDKIGIDTEEVLKAAETKWNFHKYRPGLVGGHCIGVDPYYLTYKSEQLGYLPEIILSGRRVNDNMSTFIVNKLIKAMIKNEIEIYKADILVMGLSFKENCRDLRNSKVFDIIFELNDLNLNVDVYDPLINKVDVPSNINLIGDPELNFYDAVIIAVPHDLFMYLRPNKIRKFCKKKSLIFDLKHFLDIKYSDLRL